MWRRPFHRAKRARTRKAPNPWWEAIVPALGPGAEEGIDALHPQGDHRRFLGEVDDGEDPEAEGDLAPHQVGEADHHEVDADAQAQLVLEEVEVVAAHGDDRQEPEVAVDAVVALDEEGDGEAEPEQPALEEGLDQPRALSVVDHGDRQLGHGEDQALVVDPLPPQDDHDGDHSQVHGEGEGQPVEQGRQPQPPGHAPPGGALVEVLDLAETPWWGSPIRESGAAPRSPSCSPDWRSRRRRSGSAAGRRRCRRWPPPSR